MATMTVQTITNAGITPAYAAANDGDVFTNTGNELLHVKNGGGGSITVTITPARASSDVPSFGTMSKATVSVAVAAGAEGVIGPFEPHAFNNSSGQVVVNYSGVTTVTSGAFKLPATI